MRVLRAVGVGVGLALLLASPMPAAAAASAPGAAGEAADSVARQFVGNYELVSFESFAADGRVSKREIIGRIMYDRDGNMAAQLMPLGRTEPAPDASPEERWAANRGYTAYFGKYEVDTVGGRVIHKVVGSVRQSWVGRDLVRYFEFSDGFLKLSLKRDGRVTGTLTWRRLD